MSHMLVLQDNAVPYQLKNGSILLAGTCGSINGSPIPRSLLPGSSLGSNTEKIQLLIAAPGNFFGPFRANSRSLWMEDEPGEGELQSTVLPCPPRLM